MRPAVVLTLLLVLVVPAGAVDCPAGAIHEGEPVLVDGYVDTHNPGCDGDGAFQTLTTDDFCGVTGWYEVDGVLERDTDWFTMTFPDADILYVRGQADQSTYLFVRATDCGQPDAPESWEYHLWFLTTTPVDEPSWSSVKALFD